MAQSNSYKQFCDEELDNCISKVKEIMNEESNGTEQTRDG